MEQNQADQIVRQATYMIDLEVAVVLCHHPRHSSSVAV